MKYHQMKHLLTQYGYHFLRRCRGSHELWEHQLGRTILVSRSGLTDTRSRQNWLSQVRKTIRKY